MKTLKLLLSCAVCFALAVPGLAQEKKLEQAEITKVAPEKAQIPETMDLSEMEAPMEICKTCKLPAVERPEVGDFKKDKGPAQGELNHFIYSVEANGSNGMVATVVNEPKNYALVMEKFVDGNGQLQTVKYCQGNEKYCKAIASGRKCDRNEISKDICYLEEAPQLDVQDLVKDFGPIQKEREMRAEKAVK